MTEFDFSAFESTNPYLDIFTQIQQAKTLADLPQDVLGDLPPSHPLFALGALGRRLDLPMSSMAFALRDQLVRRYAWAVPDPASIEALRGHEWLEIVSGSGYWANQLRLDGTRVIATDLEPWEKTWTPVAQLSALDAVREFTPSGVGLLTVWPEYDAPWPGQALAEFIRLGGQRVAYVGEGAGGCTGDDHFHWLLETFFTEETWAAVPRWHGIRDGLSLHRRNGVPFTM